MKKLLAFLLLSLPSFATVAFNVNAKNVAATRPNASVRVRFQLTNCKGSQPRVIATGVLLQLYYDFIPNSSGVASGSVYGNDEIDCSGQQNSYYTLIYLVNGVPVSPAYSYTIHTGAGTFDPSTATPISTTPAVIPPTGDNTYLRLDAGNSSNLSPALALGLAHYTVAALPTGTTGKMVVVTDGNSSSDCTIGGGANNVICEYNGTGWVSATGVSTSATNTWTAAQTGDWIRKGQQGFDVRAFGAKCDGATNDTAAFASAIAAATAAKGGPVLVPANGTCVANVVIDSVSGVELIGASHYATTNNLNGARIKPASTSSPTITISATTADASNDAIKDLTIIGGASGSQPCIEVNSVTNPYQAKYGTIENVSMVGCTAEGIRFDGTTNSSNTNISWKWTVRQVHVYTAGTDCYSQQGWVEQITYEDPHCGQFGNDAFNIKSFYNGSGVLSYENVILRPSIGSYSGAGSGTTSAGYDFEFANVESTSVISPYDDCGTANFARLAGYTMGVSFTGSGHSGICAANNGFVFDSDGGAGGGVCNGTTHTACTHVATRIDMENWRNLSSVTTPLVNTSTNNLILDSYLGLHGGTAGPGAAGFATTDWTGSGGAPSTAFYPLICPNQVCPISSLTLTSPSSALNTTGGSYSSPIWTAEQNRDNGAAFLAYNLSANNSAIGLSVQTGGTNQELIYAGDNNGAGINVTSTGLYIKKSGSVNVFLQPDLLTANRAIHYPDASGTFALQGTTNTSSLVTTGIVDGTVPITLVTGASQALGSTYSSGYYFNQNATAATAVTFTLPTAAAGKQYCVTNGNNGSAADTGTITIQTSAAGQYLISGGTISASGGYIISGGAAGDSACVVGIDATHWQVYTSSGSWTLH